MRLMRLMTMMMMRMMVTTVVNDCNDEGGCGDGRCGGGCGEDGGGPDLINTTFSIKGTRVRMLIDDFKEEWFAFTIVDGRNPAPPGIPCE